MRRAARWGRLWGCARKSDAKHRFAGLGRQRRQCRRAERHGCHSLTARHSRDLLMISGRVDYVTTPAPLALPPEHPLRGSSASLVLRGHEARAAGASFPRCAQSGDLPPRRVNAIVRFHFGQNPLQRNTLYLCRLRPSADPDLPSLERNCSSSLFPEFPIPQQSSQTTVLTIAGGSVISFVPIQRPNCDP